MKKFIKIILYIIIANIVAGFLGALILDLIGFEITFNTRIAMCSGASFFIGYFCPRID